MTPTADWKLVIAVGATLIGAFPSPERATVSGLPSALLATLNIALLAPVAAGVNATVTEQLMLPGKVAGETGHRLLTMPKSPGLVPATVIPVIVSGELCRFLIVMVETGDVMPTNCVGKATAAGLTETG